AVHDGLVRAVGDRAPAAAALHHIYREPDGIITIPSLAIAEGRPAGWNPADWDDHDDEWLEPEWQRALTAEACSGTTRHWDATFQRYLGLLTRACRKARKTWRATGRDIVVLVLDDEFAELLVRRVLPAAEVHLMFPEFDERFAALARWER